jgi:hypothetical protein
MATTFEVVRADALFASDLQRSQQPGADAVRHAVATTLRRLGTGGCAAAVATEFGDHPESAVARMTWALTTVHAVYAPSVTVLAA